MMKFQFGKRGNGRVAPLGALLTERKSVSAKSGKTGADEEEDAFLKAIAGDDLSTSETLSESSRSVGEEGSEASSSSENLSDPNLPPLSQVPEEEPLPSSPSEALHLSVPSSKPPLPPRRGHRRTSSALPRLETLHENRTSIPKEKPPLPPRRSHHIYGVDMGGAHPLTTASQSAHVATPPPMRTKLPNYPAAPGAGPPRPQRLHRRTASAPPTQPEGFVSVPMLEQQLDQLRRNNGPFHASVAIKWNCLGNVHFRAGQMEAALQAYKQAVLCEPGEHLADAYANMGTVHWATGNVEQAIVFLQNARSVHEYNCMAKGTDPNASLAVATVQYQLGLALSLQQDYPKAMESFYHSKAIRERVLSHSHMDVARTLDAIGKLYFRQGNFADATACHLEALTIKEVLPPTVGRSAVNLTLQHLTAVAMAQGDLVEASQWTHRLLATLKKEFLVWRTKSLCAEIGGNLLQLGDIYRQAAQESEAQDCYREADLYLSKARMPEEDPRRVGIQDRLGAR
jgi:tetratricopeptide (TPR) repeat protein